MNLTSSTTLSDERVEQDEQSQDRRGSLEGNGDEGRIRLTNSGTRGSRSLLRQIVGKMRSRAFYGFIYFLPRKIALFS